MRHYKEEDNKNWGTTRIRILIQAVLKRTEFIQRILKYNIMAAANLRQNPETLVRGTWDGQICNLRFFTNRRAAWINTFRRHYQGRVIEQDIQDALQFCIGGPEDPNRRYLTVNFYNNGTVMVQGERTVLTTFENQTFDLLRQMV